MLPTSTSAAPAEPPLRADPIRRLVERLARRSERRNDGRPGLTRRSLLVRTAVVGSVLTIAPLRWALRPASAYSEVCGSGWRCSEGWTAFCCTINDGANTCPPGSYVAGWWKIDRSPYCQGAPRYIVDCNRSPDASCRCRCADAGTCDQRRVCCNNFRYGQCNTQIPGVTEVVCRVVLCTTPWTWDPACGRTLRTDNRTTTHNAPCLPGVDATAIDLAYQELGLTGSVLGAPVGAERDAPRGGRWRRFDDGVITWREATGPVVVTGPIGRRYGELDGPSGSLGYPLSPDVEVLPGNAGDRLRFERGSLYRAGEQAIEVLGPSDARLDDLGGPGGVLGPPTAGTRPVGDGRGSVTRFRDGAIYASGGGAQELTGVRLERYEELGGPVDSGLGYPLGPSDDEVARFSTGLLVMVDGRALVLRDAIARRYTQLGLLSGPWGAPSDDDQRLDPGEPNVTRGVFAEAVVYASPTTGVRAIDHAVHRAHRGEGGWEGPLGLPTADSFVTRSGDLRGSFQGGAIELSPEGTVRVLRPRATRSPADLTP